MAPFVWRGGCGCAWQQTSSLRPITIPHELRVLVACLGITLAVSLALYGIVRAIVWSSAALLLIANAPLPPPWTVERIAGGLKVIDANGQSLAYVNSREAEDAAQIAKVLTEDEARRIASGIAKLPSLIGQGG